MDNDNPQALISITDIAGLGKALQSKAVERLVVAIIDGVGSNLSALTGPWRAKRDANAKIEIANAALQQLPSDVSINLDVSKRTEIRIRRDAEKRQENRGSVAGRAIESSESYFRSSSIEDAADCLIDAEWLSEFWLRAERADDIYRQILWSKVLLRKAGRPDDLSIRSLSRISELSQNEALMIERLAPFCVEIIAADGKSSAGGLMQLLGISGGSELEICTTTATNFEKFMMSVFEDIDINSLRSAGVIGIRHPSFWFRQASARISVGNRTYSVSNLPSDPDSNEGKVALCSGMEFTPEGLQIARIVNAPPDPIFIEMLTQALDEAGVSLSAI